MVSTWENDEREWEKPHRRGIGLLDDEVDIDPDELSPAEKEVEFVDMLLHLKSKGKVSAEEACILAYWASRAGPSISEGTTWDLGRKPGVGHYSAHLDSVTQPEGMTENTSVRDCPVYNKFDGSRSTLGIHMGNAHELLAAEVESNPHLHDRLAEMHEREELPQSYYESPVVQKHGPKAFPCAVYLDGIAFTKRDSVFALFVYNLVENRRHLIVAMRKSQFCRCGCRNWCTLFTVFLHLRWCMDAAASGFNPTTGYAPGDGLGLAGEALGAIFAFIFLKGDWAEFGPTLCFPTFSSNYAPCPLCRTPKEELVCLEDFSSTQMPFATKTYAALDRACDACEISVELSQRDHLYLRARLGYDRRNKTDAFHGRYLLEDAPTIGPGLKHGDRLEPSANLPDIGQMFDELTVFPFTVMFWRRSVQTWVYHRNPIWSEEHGFTHDRTMAIDWLHTISLGVSQFFIVFVMHLFFAADAWGTRESTEDCRISSSLDQIRRELREYYRDQRAMGVNVTEITELSASTFGTLSSPACNFKGAETNHFMPYMHRLIVRFGGLLDDAPAVLQASSSLLRCVELLHEFPHTFPHDAIEDIPPYGCGKTHVATCADRAAVRGPPSPNEL